MREHDIEISWCCAPIDLDPAWLRYCEGLLGIDEISQMQRYIDPELARAYQSSHGALRTWLGARLDTPARALRFGKDGRFGKPYLHDFEVEFSFSHATGLWAAASAHARGMKLGIDIEGEALVGGHGPRFARNVLSPEEYAEWSILSNEASQQALARVWARKEALLKGIGTGLCRPMHSLQVGYGLPVADVEAPDLGGTPRLWTVIDLDGLPRGMAGALAVCRGGARVSLVRRESSDP